MSTEREREAIDRLTRAVLAGKELSRRPEIDTRAELEQFDVVAGAFHRAPRRGRRGARRDEALGFGMDAVAVAVTTLVLTVVADTLTQLARTPAERVATGFSAWVRRHVLRRPDPSRDAPAASGEGDQPPLTREQMRRIHRSADHHARRLHIPAAIAQAIADGVVAELTLATLAPGGPAAESRDSGGAASAAAGHENGRAGR
ncbi:hypothetical protein [Streptomyces sp. NPDC054961]